MEKSTDPTDYQALQRRTAQEAIEMARRASREIRDLRAVIGRLEPKADAYDRLSQVLDLLPSPSVSMSEDLVWRLDKYASELTAVLVNPKEPDE